MAWSKNFFWHLGFISISITFIIGFSLVEHMIDNIDFHEINILERYWEICSWSKSFSDQTILKHFRGNFERTSLWLEADSSAH